MRVFLVLLGLPLLEIALFVTVGAWLGLWQTLAIVIGTGLFGIWLIRRQGERARTDLRAAMMARSNPGPALASDALTVVAGVLLVLPGFFTDTMGALLLLPPVQRLVMAYATRRAQEKVGAHLRRKAWETAAASAAAAANSARHRDERIIDGTWEEVPENEVRRPSGWTKH